MAASDVQRDPDGQIKLEQRGHLLLIGIDRPEKRNGFTIAWTAKGDIPAEGKAAKS